MDCKEFGYLTKMQILAILQLVYQLIASAAYGRFSEADDSSIDIAMKYMGFVGSSFMENLGNQFWNEAMDNMNPFQAFDIVSSFPAEKKQVFKNMFLEIVREDNSFLRLDIAKQTFRRVGISY